MFFICYTILAKLNKYSTKKNIAISIISATALYASLYVYLVYSNSMGASVLGQFLHYIIATDLVIFGIIFSTLNDKDTSIAILTEDDLDLSSESAIIDLNDQFPTEPIVMDTVEPPHVEPMPIGASIETPIELHIEEPSPIEASIETPIHSHIEETVPIEAYIETPINSHIEEPEQSILETIIEESELIAEQEDLIEAIISKTLEEPIKKKRQIRKKKTNTNSIIV